MYHVSNAGFGALVLTQGIAKKKKKSAKKLQLGLNWGPLVLYPDALLSELTC